MNTNTEIISEIREYKHSTVGSLQCLSCRNVKTFSRITKQSFIVYIKYTVADVTLFWPLKLGNTTPILYKYDFEFVSVFPCFLGHPVVNIYAQTNCIFECTAVI